MRYAYRGREIEGERVRGMHTEAERLRERDMHTEGDREDDR